MFTPFAFINTGLGTFIAAGGQVGTFQSGGFEYQYHLFTSSADFIVGSGAATASILLVGGGGAGATDSGGGGGGLIYTQSLFLVGNYGIQVGAGGQVGVNSGNAGASSISSTTISLTAGGGLGGTLAGGTLRGTSGTPQSNPGGITGSNSGYVVGGGGGGAGSAGLAGGNNGVGGAGGSGSISYILGTAEYYAGGGGGGGNVNSGSGGIGGGGNGSRGSLNATPGITNKGGGGGGNVSSLAGSAANGGSGVVIISYPIAELPPPPPLGRLAISQSLYAYYDVAFTESYSASAQTTIFDLSPNAKNGTVSANWNYNTAGVSGSVLRLATSAAGNTIAMPSLTLSGSVTFVTAWYMTSGSYQFDALDLFGGTDPEYYGMLAATQTYANRIIPTINDTFGLTQTPANSGASGSWHISQFSFNDATDTVNWCMDGTTGSYTQTATIATGTITPKFNFDSTITNRFLNSGSMMQVLALYTGSLTTQQLLDNHNSLRGRYGL